MPAGGIVMPPNPLDWYDLGLARQPASAYRISHVRVPGGHGNAKRGDLVKLNGDTYVVVSVLGPYMVKVRRTFWSWLRATVTIALWSGRAWVAKVFGL